MINYWTTHEAALAVILFAQLTRMHNKDPEYMTEYKRFKLIGKLLNRTGASVRSKYQAFMRYPCHSKESCENIHNEINRLGAMKLSFQEMCLKAAEKKLTMVSIAHKGITYTGFVKLEPGEVLTEEKLFEILNHEVPVGSTFTPGG